MRVAGEAGDADEAARGAVKALAAAGGGGEVRARAGAGAARVAGEAGEADEAARGADRALAAAGEGGEVRGARCEREPALEPRGLQERPVKLPVGQSKPLWLLL